VSSANPNRLQPQHLAKIRCSALSDLQIEALGWSSLHNGRLLIPYFQPDGGPERCHNGQPFTRERLSDQEIEQLKRQGHRKPGKYRSPAGEGCRIYHSHLVIKAGNYPERLVNTSVPLRITEGELKVEAAAVHDPKRLTIGISGVNSWRDRYDGGDESRPLVEFDELPLHGREVRLSFDSDLDKPQVLAALRGLAEFLAEKGAHVLIELLPHGLDGKRLGIDDLIYRHGPQLFQRIAAQARSPFKTRRRDGQDVPVWAFDREPIDTRERSTYLTGMLGRHWRRSPDGKDHWQRWTGAHWEFINGEDELAAAIEEFADLQGWRNRELPVFRSLQAAFRRTVATASEQVVVGLVPFRNGCLRLADGELVPHDPEHGNSWSLPYGYNPLADCQRIQAFLNDRLGDLASVALFRAFARTLVTGERTKAFLEITGPSNTGKSVITNLLTALVGSENHAAGTLQRLEDRAQRFETLKLRGKRLAVFAECQDYSGQLQTLKAITGDDAIAAEIKGGRHLDFVFTGGVVLTGNGPIRASDPTGAVINRRRSLHVGKVVAAGDERQLLESDGRGGWVGELVAELPGFVNWVLAMPAAESRSALARDVRSVSRIEADLNSLLDTDYLSEWADTLLIWDEAINSQQARDGVDRRLGVGTADSAPESFLFASYLRFMAQQGRNSTPLSLRTFKAKFVDLLRDTLGLPLPAGNTNSGDYRDRSRGSLVPCLRWRGPADEDTPGVIRHAFQRRLSEPGPVMDQPAPVMDARWHGEAKNPVSDGCDGSNEVVSKRDLSEDPLMPPDPRFFPIRGVGGQNPPQPVTSVTDKGFGVFPSVTGSISSITAPVEAAPAPLKPARGKPVEVQDAKTGAWSDGWRQIGSGKGSTHVLCTDPRGCSRQVPKARIRAAA